MDDDAALSLRYTHVFDIRINFDRRWTTDPLPGGTTRYGYTSVGEGSTISGPRLNGVVVDYSGADWPAIRPDGVVELEAHYMLQADDGALIYIRNSGYVHRLPPEPWKVEAGALAGAGYFRCTPYFRAPAGPHEWLNHTVLIGVGKRMPKVAPDDPPDHSLFRYYAIL
ncbi:MAG TPA: DUF3237 domain-containing protein [Hyphomicrobiales bacterium]|nr:DUF3237 domain-containing protein [Hyphomicrobiales bacterium]